MDFAVLLDKFTFARMLDFYREKFPINDKRIVLTQILDTEVLENSGEPIMLIDLTPSQSLWQIEQQVTAFSFSQIQTKELLAQERANLISELLLKRNKGSLEH